MYKILLLSALLGVASASPYFRPTKTGGEFPEVAWITNDEGVVVPMILHGKPTVTTFSTEDEVEFHLYNNHDIQNSVILRPGCVSCLSSSNFVRGRPVVIFAHGFGSSHNGGFGTGLKENFAEATEVYNLIFVNWGALAASPWYEWAADNTKPVGEYIARLIEFLVSEGIPISDIIFVGHSLGAHVGNYIARNLTAGLRLPIIHALDPALPLFGVKGDEDRIDPEDADFVNVIHTAMGTLWDGGLAFEEPRGDADFYPNSGKDQPGCLIDAFQSCSHSRAHAYLGESVHRPEAFSACQCESWSQYAWGLCQCRVSAQMGWHTPRDTRGVFYLRTNNRSPYGRV